MSFLVLLAGFFLCACDDSGSSGKDRESEAQAASTWYKDADGDGYGDSGVTLSQQSQPLDYVAQSGDCDDFDDQSHPAAAEICDGRDNNCNGQIDENACQNAQISISGSLQNLNSAESYFMADSYLQLVAMPNVGSPPFTRDGQDRILYDSDLPSIAIPAANGFVIGAPDLKPGRYAIAAQLIKSYGADSDLRPILVKGDAKAAVVEIPFGYATPLTVDLGDVYLPVPESKVAASNAGLECPTGVSATDGAYGDKVVVTWSAAAGATGYEVYRAGPFKGSGSFDSGELIASTTGLSYEDANVTCGSLYFYWVLATDASGSSDRCEIDSGNSQCPPPPVPTGVSASDSAFADKIRVTWNPSPGALSYDVYRGTLLTGAKTKIRTTAETSLEDASALCGLAYFYWVTAGNDSAASDFSEPDAGVFDCPPVTDPDPGQTPSPSPTPSPGDIGLDAPEKVSATDGKYPEKIVISWQSVSGAGAYDVYRATEDCDAKDLIGSTASLVFEDMTVPDKKIYYYWVKAKNGSLTSEFSIQYDTGYLMDIPPVPTGVSATDGKYVSEIRVTWKKVASATSYEVYRAQFNVFDLSSWLNRELIATTGGTGISDKDVPCSTSDSPVYYYWVKALNPAGESKLGVRDTGYAYRPPKDPTDVRATDGKYSCCVEVTWSRAARAASYDIYRAALSPDAERVKIATVKGTVTSFFDSSVTCPREYYYWVRAKDAKGRSSCVWGNSNRGYCSGKTGR